jgi:tetratricopeptide (TPR) repeat protein
VRTRLALAVGRAGADVEQRKETEALQALDTLAPQVEAEFGAFEPLHIEALNHRLRALVAIERNEDALALARRLRAGTEAKFGAGDPQTLDWVKREAIVLVNMERYDEALPIMEQACAATRKAFGDAHFATQDCNLRLGVVLFEKLRFADTVPLFEGVAAYREKTLGLDSEKTWIGWVWLARSYQRTGRKDEARALFERAYANANRVNGAGHRNAMPFGQTLGMFFEQTGDHGAAETLRRALLAAARTAYPEGHINVAKYAWDLGETLASQQRDADTVAFFNEWLPQWDSQFPAEDSRRVDAHKWFDAAQQRLAAAAAKAH